ncbi:ABC transporter substrate-binding protein [Pelagibacterium halotolerans]|uniref:Peptide/opine/nickel uptake family ABC transporter, periplasmic substrate-binding protein n=1 Tax=Pelagibacterium halotolerans (strain DSM 22347 / JCM 15775 / CGMCC 1.7692 / B2) TaxID=1082931 RepID=G4R7E1_PELHB|nr:ABC transporter substrate-binding protein [Pelagibacterium halotolerans]AEQ51277.1 peptide/opine/nickel uptake family ABC transporter, periplasmic substrate-binding protein [Pelagibacterium halotolerans B2]QJR18867.1 ABC transporter substrate-binding protein [Pelagibacterium halotolerans]SEA66647.1 peptide/nickel transport system substrate-binding protein [Pelagibacterium halotolerans]
MKHTIARHLRNTVLVGATALSGVLGATIMAYAQETITVVNASDAQPSNVMPGRAGNFPWIRNVFETVFDLDPVTYEPVPVLASDWTVSDDGLTMTLTLHDDVTFHTGRALTTDDIRYTIEVARNPETAHQLGFIAEQIEEIEILSDTEMVLHFSRPLSNIYEFFARTVVVDQETYDQRSDGSQVIGTGPYTFAEWSPGARIRLERYEDYRDPEAAAIESVDIAIINDPTATISALRSNRAQVAMQVSPNDGLEFSNSPMFNVVPTGGAQIPLGLNVEMPPFDNKLVRQAIGYAIDRERINQQVHDGLGTPTALFWAPGSPGYNETLANHYSYNPDRARELLAEAGVENPAITIALHALPGQRAVFEIVQNNLRDVGFDVQADIVDTPTFGQRQIAGELGPAFIQLQGMVGLSVPTLISSVPGIRQDNPSHFWTEEYAALREDVENAVGTDELAAAVEALSEYMIDEAFNLVLVQSPSLYVTSTDVEGVTFASTGALVLIDAEFN